MRRMEDEEAAARKSKRKRLSMKRKTMTKNKLKDDDERDASTPDAAALGAKEAPIRRRCGCGLMAAAAALVWRRRH